MANLSTSYLGFDLSHPLVPGASPLTDSLDGVRRLEDVGAPMITLRSLIVAPLKVADEARLIDQDEAGSPPRSVFAGLQDPPDHALQPLEYCEHICRVRRVLDTNIPIIASLYARRMDDWLENARLVEQTGADGIELNIYGMAIVPDIDRKPVEQQIIELVNEVKGTISIPIAVKMLPFHKTFDYFVRKLPKAGADGLVLFNGFYQSNWNVDALNDPFLHAIASPLDPHYRFRWLSRLSGGIGTDLAFSGGARNAVHAIKAAMCGAKVVQLVTALIRHGPQRLQSLVDEMNTWLDEHGYELLQQVRGRVSMQAFDSLESFEMTYNRNILMQPS
jgi:dihydroorotate dehydrogenase (fumarate)